LVLLLTMDFALDLGSGLSCGKPTFLLVTSRPRCFGQMHCLE